MSIESNKKQIVDALLATRRLGVNDLIKWMDNNGFFTAPASGSYHLCCEGGLAQHSLNVLETMRSITKALATEETAPDDDTIVICALLHDLGKVGDFGKPNYVVNMIKDGRPTKAEPEQKYKQSEDKPFKTNPDLLYIPHEIRSITIAERFMSLTESEEFAIVYHNGLYGDLKYAFTGKETPLALLLHFADMWVSRVVEAKEDKEDA